MPFTEEQIKEVGKALSARMPNSCTSCAKENTRTIAPEVFVASGYDLKKKHFYPLIPDAFLACVVTVCSNCGNVEFYSVHALGLGSVLGVPPVNQNMFGG
jgi:hypothetical protein